MNRSLSANALHLQRGIFYLAFLALFSGIFFQTRFPSEIHAQHVIKDANLALGTEATAPTSGDQIFLQLADGVGQKEAATRLIDYKLKNEPGAQKRYWAVVDFNQPSTSKRFYVFDTVDKKVSAYYVAHGRRSGENLAERFSNVSGSNSSSLGIYRSLGEYVGHHGRSLRLEGLEPTNSNVLARAVVMHTADYVSEAFIRQTGRLGRSEGCFAVERSAGDTLIDELKDGAYIIASKS